MFKKPTHMPSCSPRRAMAVSYCPDDDVPYSYHNLTVNPPRSSIPVASNSIANIDPISSVKVVMYDFSETFVELRSGGGSVC